MIVTNKLPDPFQQYFFLTKYKFNFKMFFFLLKNVVYLQHNGAACRKKSHDFLNDYIWHKKNLCGYPPHIRILYFYTDLILLCSKISSHSMLPGNGGGVPPLWASIKWAARFYLYTATSIRVGYCSLSLSIVHSCVYSRAHIPAVWLMWN